MKINEVIPSADQQRLTALKRNAASAKQADGPGRASPMRDPFLEWIGAERLDTYFVSALLYQVAS